MVKKRKYAIVSLSCQKIALSNDTFLYDGKEKRPRVMIDGLTEGKDYTVVYKNNILAGTGIVTITGIGPNTGQVVKKIYYQAETQAAGFCFKRWSCKNHFPR